MTQSVGSIILTIVVGALLANNFVLIKFLGICPFLGVSKKTDTALGMGLAVIFVMGIASIFAWLVELLLESLHVEYLQTIAFIFVIAALVQIVEMVLKKFLPGLYSALGVYLPLITTNCAVLGVAILSAGSYPVLVDGLVQGASLGYWFLNGIFSGAGFTLAILLLAGIRERTNLELVPKAFRGFPITLITACIMSMAFSAFSGVLG